MASHARVPHPRDAAASAGAAAVSAAPRRWRRLLLWGLLLALLAVAQTLLVALTLRYEAWRVHGAAEAAAAEAGATLRRDLLRLTHALQAQSAVNPADAAWRAAATALLQGNTALRRIEARDTGFAVVAAADSMLGPTPFQRLARAELTAEVDIACREAQRSNAPAFSRSYFAPLAEGTGQELTDLCVPVRREGREAGYLVASIALPAALEAAGAAAQVLQRHELSLVEADGARLARAGARRGAGVHMAEHTIDLPGQPLRLRADSLAGHPSLIPNLTLALVLGLSLALFGVVFALARDVRRRAAAEQALADALRFRKAMEDSLITGLRARDMDGAITYVNPAFCAMVGFSADELRAVRPPQPPPYWPPERLADYAARQLQRRAASDEGDHAAAEPREGFEILFVRKDGERFPAMVYEAPLLDGEGRQTGWMSAVLDISSQRRIEDLSRQQQERLQASARLATMGEMASLLSHELNQPLAAIASYASGSLNLLHAPAAAGGPVAGGETAGATPAAELAALLGQALARIAEQAERAGRVIKSVHDFVRRREQLRESVPADALFDAVLPLVRLQARKSATQVEVELPRPPERMPRAVGDRTMLEQVLLNLARNGIQAMETETPASERRLVLAARADAAGRVVFEVRDAGPGIAPGVAARLFTPFFTTRAEGMGLGLSLCRTVIEQHGGTLEFAAGPGGRGTLFRFTLPGPKRRADHAGADGSAGPAPAAASALPPRESAPESGDTAGGRRLADAAAAELVDPERTAP
ncbi:MAG: PAS domain S-box protein [Rubrivivax sp.]|nr:PAS domain S-box protein [Rubrivivax sp.]